MKRLFQTCLGLCMLFLASCTAYQLGRPAASVPSSVYLAPVVNRADVPQVRALLTDALREEFLRAGGWQLQSENAAEARIEVTLVAFERSTAATSSTDTGRGVSFENRLVAEVTALGTKTGEVLLRPFTIEASSLALIDPSLPDSEYQTLPALSAELAARIQDRLAYTW